MKDYPELIFPKLKSVAHIWAEKYDHIAEISFFKTSDKSQPWGIDVVVCCIPGVVPTLDGYLGLNKKSFFTKGPNILKHDLLNALDPQVAEYQIGGKLSDYGDRIKNQGEDTDQWRVITRWESDTLDVRDLIPDSITILYSAQKVNSLDEAVKKFSKEDYEYLGRLSTYTDDECLALLFGGPLKSEEPIFRTNVWVNPEFIQNNFKSFIDSAKKMEQQIQRAKQIFNRSIEAGEIDLWGNSERGLFVDAEPFIEWAKRKGFIIPIGMVSDIGPSQNEAESNLSDKTTKQHDHTVKKDEVDNRLRELCPELELFYSDIINDLENRNPTQTLEEVDQYTLYQIAIECFQKSHRTYERLTMDFINNENLYRKVERRRRAIIVGIMRAFIKKEFCGSFKHINTTYETLLTKHNEFKEASAT